MGRSVRRREDRRFLTGDARYVDDIVLPGMVHMVVVRSSFAHAGLGGIAAEHALRVPGVVAVVTSRDLGGRVEAMSVASLEGAEVAPVPHPLLANGKVRYVGEPVAALLAEDRAAAEDAAELVGVDYEPLPALADPRAALESDVLLHEALGENVLIRWARSGGDVAGAFATADRVVRERFHIPRLVAAPIEPRGVVAAYDRGADLLTLWCSAQDPHRPLAQLSGVLDRPEDRIRVVVPDVGGSFGSKGWLAPEGALAAVLAIELGRPVKWIESRSENFLAAHQGRGLDAEVELAVDRGGTIAGVKARLIADVGAYVYPNTAVAPVTTAMLLTGAYDISAAQVEVVGAATSKVPIGPYRGAGRPEATLIVERMVDLAALELGLDPLKLRLRNLIPPGRFPHRTPLGFVYDSGDYARALERARALVEYDRWREEQARARERGELVGIGVALYVERAAAGLWESAAVSVERSGRVVVRTGSTPHGQGHETTFAQIAADLLSLDLDAIVVEHGDSALVPRGVGTYASRSVTVGGSALVIALEKIKAKAEKIAAHMLEATVEDIVWRDGRLHVRGTPERAVSFREVAAAAYRPGRLGPELEMGLAALGYFDLPGPVFPFGAYAAVVQVAPETGEVQVLRLVAVDDAGRIVNPLLAEGQVVGAAVQGLGQALVEEAVHDETGQPRTGTYLDYRILRAPDVPPVVSELLETTSPLNPLGAKGIGEAGAIGTPAAVANAVIDALTPLGVRHVDLPLTEEKLWRACLDRSSSAGEGFD